MAISTIPVVDDDPKATDMLRRTLIYEGYRVITAANGVDALAAAREKQPALMLVPSIRNEDQGLAGARNDIFEMTSTHSVHSVYSVYSVYNSTDDQRTSIPRQILWR